MTSTSQVIHESPFLSSLLEACAPKPKPCRFCNRPGILTFCSWPVLRFHAEPAGDLTIGDYVRSEMTHKRCRVVNIIGQHLIREYYLQFPDKEVFPYRWSIERLVPIERPAICEAPCCFTCHREVAPDRHYCADHWHEWEFVS